MSSGPKQYAIHSLAMPFARALLAIIVALSFLTTIVSVGTASPAGAATMACCIGKTGHESGSCSTGMLALARKPQPEPDVLRGQEPPAPKMRSIKAVHVKAEVEHAGHCGLYGASAGDVPSDAARPPEPEATSANTEKPGVPVIHTLSRPCSAECVTCSMSYARRPRPRDQSTPSSPTRPRLHFICRVLPSNYPRIKTLNAKWMQLRPRAPPVRLS